MFVVDNDELSDDERRAITSLQRLAKRWPKTLTLASMGGSLCIVRTGDPRFEADSARRWEAEIASINGIPNTGGDW